MAKITVQTIYEQNKNDVYSYLLSLTHNKPLSEDLTSDVFLGAIKALPAFKGNSSIKLGYKLFKKKTYFVPLGLFLFSFVWVSIREIVKGFLTYSTVVDLLIMSAWWSGIFAAFSGVGVLIAGLLYYAFKKER